MKQNEQHPFNSALWCAACSGVGLVLGNDEMVKCAICSTEEWRKAQSRALGREHKPPRPKCLRCDGEGMIMAFGASVLCSLCKSQAKPEFPLPQQYFEPEVRDKIPNTNPKKIGR